MHQQPLNTLTQGMQNGSHFPQGPEKFSETIQRKEILKERMLFPITQTLGE